jgi:hypothetical protein
MVFQGVILLSLNTTAWITLECCELQRVVVNRFRGSPVDEESQTEYLRRRHIENLHIGVVDDRCKVLICGSEPREDYRGFVNGSIGVSARP